MILDPEGKKKHEAQFKQHFEQFLGWARKYEKDPKTPMPDLKEMFNFKGMKVWWMIIIIIIIDFV